MGMQYDVLTTHLNQSGLVVSGRNRLKGVLITGTATGGTVNFWDSLTAPVSATYARSGYTITVTKVAHGLVAGQGIGLAFSAAGGAAGTNGNYTVATVVDADNFTVTDINTGTVASSTACQYVVDTPGSNDSSDWLFTTDTASVTSGANVVFFSVPGEGILAHSGIWCTFTNMTGVTTFYG